MSKPTIEEMREWLDFEIDEQEWAIRTLGEKDDLEAKWQRELAILTAIRDELARPRPSVTTDKKRNASVTMFRFGDIYLALHRKVGDILENGLRSLGVEVTETKEG